MPMFAIVTITELDGRKRVFTHAARTRDRDVAAARCIRRHYGKAVFFQQDAGLPWGYGQLFRSLGNNQATSVSGRIRIEVKV